MSQAALPAPINITPKRRPIRRATEIIFIETTPWLILLLIGLNLYDFNTLPQHYCHGTTASSAGYCDLQNIKCLPVPTNCPDTWRGWIATNKFDFGNIVPPAWSSASLLGYIWFVMLLVGGSVCNTGLFVIYLLKEPFLTSPVFFIIIWLAAGFAFYGGKLDTAPANAEPGFDPLNRAGLENPLGEAAFATASDAHAAFLGVGPEHSPAPLFED